MVPEMNGSSARVRAYSLNKAATVQSVRNLRPGNPQWQRFCNRLTDAILFGAGQGGRGYPTCEGIHERIYDALEDVFGDEFTPEELERLADVVLRRLR